MAESVERAPGMRANRRTRIVEAAAHELGEAMLKIIKEHKLTDAEIQVILNREAATWLKYELRHERHPGDSSKGADEE